MITALLSSTGDYHVTVADASKAALSKIEKAENIRTLKLDVTDSAALNKALNKKFAVLSAAPFHVTTRIADAAVKNKVHYFDLTEDVAATRHVKQLAKKAQSVLMPQCGLAPGFITIAASHLIRKFEELHTVRMRVGALTEFPVNGLKYNLTWSTAGLINEYIQPCEAIVGGTIKEVEPLAGLETFSLDGLDYEAFNTSGGLGTLCETLKGKVTDLNYKTVRYPGHCEIMRLLLHDLKLKDRPELLIDIFETALPVTYQDVVLIFATVTGTIDGQLMQETYAKKVYSGDIGGKRWSAIQITTASGICGALDLVAAGKLPQKGFVKQEDVVFDDFMASRFGKNFGRRERSRD